MTNENYKKNKYEINQITANGKITKRTRWVTTYKLEIIIWTDHNNYECLGSHVTEDWNNFIMITISSQLLLTCY